MRGQIFPLTLIVLVNVASLSITGCSKQEKLPPAFNVSLAARQGMLAAEVKSDPAKAISDIGSFQASDKGNGMNDYLMAAAYARQSKWPAVIQSLKKGNVAPSCTQYVTNNIVTLEFPVQDTLTNLVLEARTAAPALGESGPEVFSELRWMGKRLILGEPRLFIPGVQGAILCRGAESTRARLLRNSGQQAEAEAAKQHAAAYDVWLKKVKAAAQDWSSNPANMLPLALKHHLSTEEMIAFSDKKQSLTPETIKKYEGFSADCFADERRRMNQLMASLPQ